MSFAAPIKNDQKQITLGSFTNKQGKPIELSKRFDLGPRTHSSYIPSALASSANDLESECDHTLMKARNEIQMFKQRSRE